MIDLTDRNFGRLTVIDLAELDRHGHYIWSCLCDCGRQVRAAIEGALAQLDEDDGLFVELQEALKTPNVNFSGGATTVEISAAGSPSAGKEGSGS